MLDNLLIKYLIDEEEKYPFYPKVNGNNINFIFNNNYLKENNDKILLFSERNLKSKLFNKKYKVDYYSSYFNKCFQNAINRKEYRTNSTPSFSCKNNNLSDLNHYYNEFNNIYKYISLNKNIRQYKRKSMPISLKYKNKLYNSLFNEENEGDLLKETFNNNKSNLKKNSTFSFYPKQINSKKINIIYNIPYNYHIGNKNNFLKLKKELNKKKGKNNKIKEIQIQKKQAIIENNKHLILNNDKTSIQENSINSIQKNYNSSLYNISSIDNSVKKEKNVNKSPEKKEYLFSFGSDLFFIDNNNTNHSKSFISKSLIKKLKNKNITTFQNDRKNNHKIKNRNNNRIKVKNNIIKTKSNNLTGNNHMSTNYSASNSIYNINNHKNKNEILNMNKLEVQSTNSYYILNDKIEELKNANIFFQTTLQTLNDSKIFDLAKECISQDDSLENYRKKLLSNKMKE